MEKYFRLYLNKKNDFNHKTYSSNTYVKILTILQYNNYAIFNITILPPGFIHSENFLL